MIVTPGVFNVIIVLPLETSSRIAQYTINAADNTQ